jgi:cytochrome c oxidase assembly protein subunit 15
MNGVRRALGRLFTPTALFGVAIAATIATWLMLLIGGTVNPTGSSLACTDWSFTWGFVPLCNGDAFPTMTGGVLYEHGHRLWGWLVGVFTTAVVIGAWATPTLPRATRWLAFGALLLVIAQGALGGITVLVGLNPAISTAHLVVGYGFLVYMLHLTWRLSPRRRHEPTDGQAFPRSALIAAAVLTLGQIILGGAIRHLGAGLICGMDPVGCNHQGLWPEGGPQQLHMLHRYLGYFVAVAVVAASWMARTRAIAIGRPHIARLALAPILLVVAQVVLGLVTVMSGRIVAVVTLHTAIGGLLLAAVAALYYGFGPLGAPRPAHSLAPEASR